MTSSEEELKDALWHAAVQLPEGYEIVKSSDLAAAQKENEAEQRETESIHQIRLDLLKKWKALSADYDRLTETMHRHAEAGKQFLAEAEAADEAAHFWRAKVESLQADLSASHQREEQMRRALDLMASVLDPDVKDWFYIPDEAARTRRIEAAVDAVFEARRTLSEDSHDEGGEHR